jgi:hypothetical protein
MSDLVTEYTTARKNLEERIRDIRELTGVLTELERDLLAVLEEDKPVRTLKSAALKESTKKTTVAKIPDAHVKAVLTIVKRTPGISRAELNEHFKDHAVLGENGNLTNAIGRLSKSKQIVNRGGRRSPQWFINE